MKKLITAVSVALMMIAGTAYAASTVDQCTYDRDTKIAIVSGTTDSEEVTLSVQNQDQVYYETQQTASEGEFQFKFQLQGDSRAEYSILVGGTAADPVTTTLTYYGNEVDNTFTKLNEYANVKNLSAFQELLTQSLDIMGLELSQEELSAIPYMSSVIMESAPFLKVNELKTAFETAKYLYDLSAISDPKSLNTIIKSNADRFKANYANVYGVYSDFAETKQEEICTAMIQAINHKVVTEETFNDIFVVQTMRNAIRSASGWSAAKDLVTKTKSELQITASTLSTNSEVYLKMMNADYKALSDFNTVYTQAVKAVSDSQKGSSSGGGSSSSSGGSSSSSGSGISSFVPKPPVQESETESGVKFQDIGKIAWAKEAIEGLAKEKIISGRDENTFDPNAPVLREEFIKMLVLVFDMKVQPSETHFSDVADNAWYADYVDTAMDAELVSGMEDHAFGVGREITRQDMVAITYRAMQKYQLIPKDEAEAAEDESFSDDSLISDYAHEGIYALKKLKIVSGREDGGFDPKANLSRAEAAKILYSVRNMKLANDYVTEEKGE